MSEQYIDSIMYGATIKNKKNMVGLLPFVLAKSLISSLSLRENAIYLLVYLLPTNFVNICRYTYEFRRVGS